MTFTLYVIGFVLFIGGLAYAAHRIGVSDIWIGIGAVILLGIAIFTGAVKARKPDPSE